MVRPDPGAFFDRLDRNGDGRLGGDEMENMPGFFRGMVERAGIREGASRDDFSRGMDRVRQEFQERRESGDSGRGGDDRGRGDDRSSGRSGYKPAEKPRVTLDLPEGFRERDSDEDGQIGLYEWREWDRASVDEFLLLDRNGDGFLTPRELAPADEDSDRNSGGRSSSREGGRTQPTSNSSSRSDGSGSERRRGQ